MKEVKKNKKVTPLLLSKAKARYMKYESVSSISKDMKLSRTTLTYHIKKEWEVEREMSKAELFNRMSATKK